MFFSVSIHLLTSYCIYHVPSPLLQFTLPFSLQVVRCHTSVVSGSNNNLDFLLWTNTFLVPFQSAHAILLYLIFLSYCNPNGACQAPIAPANTTIQFYNSLGDETACVGGDSSCNSPVVIPLHSIGWGSDAVPAYQYLQAGAYQAQLHVTHALPVLLLRRTCLFEVEFKPSAVM